MGLINVGLPVKLGEHCDPGYIVSNKYSADMKLADIIPVNFKLAIADLLDDSKGFPVEYTFAEAAKEYGRKLSAVGLGGGAGCRVYLGKETNGSISISNEFIENFFSESLNQMVSENPIFAKMRSMAGSAGYSGGGSGITKSAPSTGLKSIGNMLIDGKHMSLPKIWKTTNFTQNLSLVTNLISPYGSKRSIKKHIIEPLAALVCLLSPSSNDGLTFGNPPYVLLKAYGLQYNILAYCSDISITAAGGGETTNIYKQLMNISVSMSFSPAAPGFAAMVDGDIATVGDAMSTPPSMFGRGPAITTVGQIINSLCPSPLTSGSPELYSGAGGLPSSSSPNNTQQYYGMSSSNQYVNPGFSDSKKFVDDIFNGI